jgi:hypothetical protein
LEYTKNILFEHYFSGYGSKRWDKIPEEKNKSGEKYKEAHKGYENRGICEAKKSSTCSFEFKRIY